jgi:hypothetical protein
MKRIGNLFLWLPENHLFQNVPILLLQIAASTLLRETLGFARVDYMRVKVASSAKEPSTVLIRSRVREPDRRCGLTAIRACEPLVMPIGRLFQ